MARGKREKSGTPVRTGKRSPDSYNIDMAQEPRYTDDHAKAGLEFAFPAIIWPA